MLCFISQTYGLSLDPVLHRELVFLPSKHLTFDVSGGIMSRPCKRPRLLQPGEISELVLTLIVTNQDYQATSFQLRGVLKVCQGCHNLTLTAKQPVVTSPGVQFHPVPLTKRMLVRMGQVNRLNSQ